MSGITTNPRAVRAGPDKLGAVFVVLAIVGVLLPFATFRANRIVLGDPRAIWAALPLFEACLLLATLIAAAVIALRRRSTVLRLAVSLVTLIVLLVSVGRAGTFLTPVGDSIARVSPASGFWVLLFTFVLYAADALTRLGLSPRWRMASVVLTGAALALFLASGAWDDLSILKEYASRAASFWREAQRHVFLAVGSLLAATVVGVPLGVLCYRSPRLRAVLLNVLNIIQTIPSMALFGLLIAPLAWIAATIPGAAAIGIAGIGPAPAFVALFAYSLLPVVSNTVVGLDGVPLQARDAALGMGMTERQTLLKVEGPLAFPVILTGIRIVLVQNVGLATIAGLIGGGGFGVFVFQGMGQTAADLILLGALPTVLLAFAAAILLDAVIDLVSTPATRSNSS